MLFKSIIIELFTFSNKAFVLFLSLFRHNSKISFLNVKASNIISLAIAAVVNDYCLQNLQLMSLAITLSVSRLYENKRFTSVIGC